MPIGYSVADFAHHVCMYVWTFLLTFILSLNGRAESPKNQDDSYSSDADSSWSFGQQEVRVPIAIANH